jgi:hypothetical protein
LIGGSIFVNKWGVGRFVNVTWKNNTLINLTRETRGAAIASSSVFLTFRSCVFTNNSVLSTYGAHAAAVYIANWDTTVTATTRLTFVDTTFANNTARTSGGLTPIVSVEGGAVYVQVAPVRFPATTLVVRRTTFTGNRLTVHGTVNQGATYVSGGGLFADVAYLEMSDSRFESNVVRVRPSSTLNRAFAQASALYIRNFVGYLDRVTVANNSATCSNCSALSLAAGTLAIDSASVQIRSTVIRGNAVAGPSAKCGGIYTVRPSGDMSLTQVSVVGNVAFSNGSLALEARGGGLCVESQGSRSVTLDKCTVSGNQAVLQGSTLATVAMAFGGGISVVAGGTGAIVISSSNVSLNRAWASVASPAVQVGAAGGGIHAQAAQVYLNSTTVHNNSAVQAGAVGTGPFARGGGVAVQGSVVWATGGTVFSLNTASSVGTSAGGAINGSDVRLLSATIVPLKGASAKTAYNTVAAWTVLQPTTSPTVRQISLSHSFEITYVRRRRIMSRYFDAF